MPDLEKVLKALEHHKETAVCNGCPYAEDDDTSEGYCPIYDDTIALLREHDDCENCAIAIEDRQLVVRCKDCKYCEYPDSDKEWCKKGHLHRKAETWFCADGERR